LPRLFLAFTKTVSPTLASILGIGHTPFIPIVGLSNAPSGFALTHPIVKSYDTVAAKTAGAKTTAHPNLILLFD